MHVVDYADVWLHQHPHLNHLTSQSASPSPWLGGVAGADYPPPAGADCSTPTLGVDADESSEDDEVSSLPSLSSSEEASSSLEAISTTG